MSYSWVPRGLAISGEATGDQAGTSVSLSANGSVVAIGAVGNNGAAGQVRVYEWDGSAWIQRGADIDGAAGADNSGYSVSLSANGSVVAIGAPNAPSGDGFGQVRVYDWDGSTWIKRAGDIDGQAAGDNAGASVSLSADGTVLAIGAPYNDNGSGSNAGHVRIFHWDGAEWNQRGLDINGETADSAAGYSVSLSSDGTVVAIGAPYNSGTGSTAGQVRVYAWVGSAWVQRGLDIDGEAASDNAGISVSLSANGSIVAIGAPYNDGKASNAGHVRVYEWVSNAWVQRGLDIDGNSSGDESGRSVSLSSDGSVVAIGAPYNNNGGGTDAGHVRVYAWSGSAWVMIGADIIGSSAFNHFGSSVSLSTDGSFVAIGAPNNGTGGAATGQTRIFSLETIPVENPPAPVVEVPCFFGNSRVLTPTGYRRMDSLTVGDMVMTPQGTEVAIERVKITECVASPTTNPYVIPAGTFGANHRTLISPNHKVCLEDGRRVEAKHLGLTQEAREGSLTYYNLELTGTADMIVGGVAVESLAPVRRVVMSLADFSKAVTAKYGPANPAILEHIKRTCRFVGKDAVEVPVMRR